MTEREAEESAEVEARWKEFWADHKDYDPSWVPEFLGELREDLPFVFGNSAYEAFVLMYERNGVELPKGPPDVASYHPQLTPRELYKLPIGQFAFGVRAYAYYGVWPHWLDSPDRDFGEYLSAFGRGMFAAGWSLFGNETPDDNDIDDRRAIIAAFARQKLDPPIDYGLTPDELAALARVSRKSIMNLLAPGSGGILQLDTEKLITPESASRWLLGRADFRPSIWEKQKGKSTWRPGSKILIHRRTAVRSCGSRRQLVCTDRSQPSGWSIPCRKWHRRTDVQGLRGRSRISF